MLVPSIEQRILYISKKHNLSHLSSCLSAATIIRDIYETKRKEDVFILSSGHAGLALYCVLEKFEGVDAEALYLKHGVHPNRDLGSGIYISSGSLGHGLGIAIGMAHANRQRTYHVLLSDGEIAEGSCWEARNYLHTVDLPIKVYINHNGYSAFDKTDLDLSMNFYNWLKGSNQGRLWQHIEIPRFLEGVDGHYVALTDETYADAMNYYAEI